MAEWFIKTDHEGTVVKNERELACKEEKKFCGGSKYYMQNRSTLEKSNVYDF